MSLNRLIDLRKQKAEIEEEIKAMEMVALEEALDLASDLGRQTFEYQGVKVQLRFKNRPPKPSEDPRLEELHHRIQAEIEALQIRNRSAIKAQNAAIKAATDAITALTTSDEIKSYQAQYDTLAAELTTKDPQLALTL